MLQFISFPIRFYRLLGIVTALFVTSSANTAELPKTIEQLEQATKRFGTIIESVANAQTRHRYVQQEAPALALAASLLGETETSWGLLGQIEDAEHALQSRGVQMTLPATVAAMHRRLMKMDVQDRYELLRSWTMPSGDRERIRSFNTLTTDVAPPPEFSQALNERPSRQAFELPRIGSVAHLFCTMSLLVDAANDAVQTAQLRRELQAAQVTGIEGAEFGLLLIDFRSEVRSADFVQRVRRALQQAVETESDAKSGQIWPMDVLVLSAFCLHRDDVRTDAVRCLSLAFERLRSGGDRAVRGCLRRAYFLGLDFEAFAGAGGDVNSARARADRISLIDSAAPKHWISFGVEDATKRVKEKVVNVDPIWLTHEGHILHAYGGDIDFLCLRYPLIGNFRFSFDGQDGGSDAMASGLLWNGLSHRVGGYRSGAIYSLNSPNKTDQLEWQNPFVVHQTAAQFNELALEVDRQRSTTFVNGQTMWSEAAAVAMAETNDKSGFTRPWVGFRCASEFSPLARNVKISGDARIPREVPLLDADLRGWIASWFSHSRPPAFADAITATPIASRSHDWSLKEGVLSRNQQLKSSHDAVSPSRLCSSGTATDSTC